jgi:hypothetical protein
MFAAIRFFPSHDPAMSAPSTLVFLAPLFIVFEVVQLVAAEKLLGVKKIRAGIDPRQSSPGEAVSALWASGILAQGVWTIALLSHSGSRVHAACILLVWLTGFSLRGNCTLRWVLVILTIEGALRLGLMTAMFGSAWRAL